MSTPFYVVFGAFPYPVVFPLALAQRLCAGGAALAQAAQFPHPRTLVWSISSICPPRRGGGQVVNS